MVSVLLVLPYGFSLQSEVISQSPLSIPMLALISFFQSAILFAIAVYFGIKLNRKIGFNFPLLDAWMEGKKIDYSKTLVLSIISGLVVGLVIVLLNSFLFSAVEITAKAPIWQGFLGAFYGGIAEEVLMRLFLMSLSIFILTKLFKLKKENRFAICFSIILVAVLFGLGHLPITSAITKIDTLVVVRAIVLNGVGGVLFGWLYWKKGLESAIISHFCADLILLVALPLLS